MDVYFVIYYDSKTGRLEIDDETACARFPQGLIYDNTCDDWLDQAEHSGIDLPASQVVKAVVKLYNSVLKQTEPSP